ncbi:MAG: hypothetical protein ATN33_04715 [Epulopiscium sp. Nele67-Bin001]|nr:MAG: hypothetical protein ATN33_04715 [Epulopiscium sp. Nele67-Bin001]
MNFIDFHCDTASLIYEKHHELYINGGHVDIVRMKKAHYAAQWFAFFVNLQSLDLNETAFDRFTKMYDYFVKQVSANEDDIEIVSTYEQYKAARENDKIAAFLSIEEGEVVKDGLSYVDKLEQMGITLMTLTWNFKNSLGTPHNGLKGLSHYGKEVVEYLNSKKILVDVSHLSDMGMDDVLSISKKPVIASHSNARTYKAHSRNLCDRHIREIASTGGVIGLNFYNEFLAYSGISKMDDLIGMIRYLYRTAGSDAVVLGTDFDGIDCSLEIAHCGQLPKFRSALTKRFSPAIVDKFMYKNAERLIKENF